MSAKFVHVVRTKPFEVFFRDIPIRVRHPKVFNVREARERDDNGETDYTTCELFEIDEADLDTFLSAITLKNPGVEVRVYETTMVAQRPAADMVKKKVTKEGVLPA